METLRRTRTLAVRISLLLIAAGAGLAYPWSAIVAQGILLGGIAGVLAFWILALRVEKLAAGAENSLQAFSFKWTAVRMALYFLALGKAFYLDRVEYTGLMAAVAALFVIRIVMIFLAFTGLDLNKEADQ